MKLPNWLDAELDRAAVRIVSGDADREGIIEEITGQVIARDALLTHGYARRGVAKEIRERIKAQLVTFYRPGDSGGEPGGQLELFAALPRVLETSPGRFAHISAMTGPDWDAALRQAEVKADNSGHYAKAIRRAHEQVRPLLRDDDSLTTADIAGKLAGGTA